MHHKQNTYTYSTFSYLYNLILNNAYINLTPHVKSNTNQI